MLDFSVEELVLIGDSASAPTTGIVRSRVSMKMKKKNS
jgi:hypothetical protein